MTLVNGNARPQTLRRVAVIGGGIAGLAAALRVVELEPSAELTLLDAGARLGGVLDTLRHDGWLLERSADGFITNVPWGMELCARLNVPLLATRGEHRRALVVRRGRLVPVPEGFVIMAPSQIWPMVATPLLSPWGKLRLAAETLVPPRTDGADESLAEFATRRFGREVFDRLVQPLVAGIYTSDGQQLSVRATMPRFVELEQRYGSLIRGLRAEQKAGGGVGQADATGSGARYSLFVTPRDGMTSLVQAMTARLPAGAVRLNARATRLARTPSGWSIAIAAGTSAAESVHEADVVIVATPAHRAAELLAEVDAELSADLARIPYAGCSIAALGYRRDQIAHPLDGFGFVVPAAERRDILSASFSSVKYDGRAPEDHVLVRVFIGGALRPELNELDDAELVALARSELAELLGASGEPVFQHVARWPAAMPQYQVGHCELVERIQRRVERLGRLALAGNAYRGVGMPHCIHGGHVAAETVLAATGRQPPQRV
jgi:protoporphyrinogen/coproporphyrinogen III oxidase